MTKKVKKLLASKTKSSLMQCRAVLYKVAVSVGPADILTGLGKAKVYFARNCSQAADIISLFEVDIECLTR